MAKWLTFLSSQDSNCRVFVQADQIAAVRETVDQHAVIVLDNGAELPVTARAVTVMAKITSPPAPPVMVVHGASALDTNRSVTGSAEAWSNVAVKDGANFIGSAVADENGDWSVGIYTPPGSHLISAEQTNIFGLKSGPSSTASFTVAAPPPPQPVEVSTEDDGASGAGDAGAAGDGSESSGQQSATDTPPATGRRRSGSSS